MPHPFCGDVYSERGRGRELLDGWSGGVRDILNRRVGRRRDRDVAGLSVVELLQEVCGDDGVVSDEGVELMVSGCRGVDGWVRVSGHPLAVEDAEGVSTEGGVGMAMFDGGSWLQFSTTLRLLLWGWRVGSVEVPRWGWQVPEGDWGVEGVVAVGLVRGGGSQDGRCVLLRIAAPFIWSSGFRW